MVFPRARSCRRAAARLRGALGAPAARGACQLLPLQHPGGAQRGEPYGAQRASPGRVLKPCVLIQSVRAAVLRREVVLFYE